jgi:hypothetical protein
MRSPIVAAVLVTLAQPALAQATYSAPELHVETDRFTGTRDVYAGIVGERLDLPGFEFGSPTMVSLQPFYRALADGRGTYLWTITVIAREWAFVDGSAELLIDGGRVTLRPSMKPETNVVSGGLVTEQFNVRIPPEVMRRVAAAKLVEIRLTGSKQTIESHLTEEHVAQGGRF